MKSKNNSIVKENQKNSELNAYLLDTPPKELLTFGKNKEIIFRIENNMISIKDNCKKII
jgi:hypothetical protein